VAASTTPEESLLASRLRSQLVSGPRARGPLAVAERLLAIQAQDPRGARLAVRVRATPGLSAAAVERALSDGSLVISWLCRGTLHMVAREDYGWLHALMAPRQLAGSRRRLAQLGVSERVAERGVATIERSLLERGPLTREQLRGELDEASVPTEGQALVHLLILAAQRGLILRGPMVGSHHAFVLVRDWLGEQPVVDRDSALAELARRYLAGHAPADDRDLAKWSGLALGEVRRGLAVAAAKLRRRADGLFEPATRRSAADLPPPRLLGAFDPVLLGWSSRAPIVGEHAGIVSSNGLFRPIALVGGRAVATWAMPAGRVVLAPFGELDERDAAALDAEAADVERYLARA
jgi:hypothetical protein